MRTGMRADWCNIKVSAPWRSTGHWRDVRIWLIDNVGASDYDLDGAGDDPDKRLVYFAYEKDAMMFMLRWA